MVADQARLIGIEKPEGAVIQGQAQDGHIVGVHHAMGETYRLPARNQMRGARDNLAEPGGMIVFIVRHIFGDDMIGQQAHQIVFAIVMEMLEMAEADMAARQPRYHGAGLGGFALNLFVGGDQRQGAGGGDAKACHRFAAEIFANGGAHHGAAIAEA